MMSCIWFMLLYSFRFRRKGPREPGLLNGIARGEDCAVAMNGFLILGSTSTANRKYSIYSAKRHSFFDTGAEQFMWYQRQQKGRE